jgi:peptidoglycan/LPS O-acetylase OafA/YrhL
MRQRYLVLDGLRGVAAAAVVIYHAGLALDVSVLISRAYLAVDFFFVLSGFVIAHAYEDALNAGTLRSVTFLGLRLRRLWPLSVFGTAIGLVMNLAAPSIMGSGVAKSGEAWLIFGLALFLVPNPALDASEAYPLNPPVWSLVYEIFANYAYALLLKRLTSRVLCAVVALAGLGLLVTALRQNGANTLSPVRVVYAFFCGVLIYRSSKRGRNLPAVPSMLLGAVLAVVLFLPDVKLVSHGAIDASLTLVVFPVLVWLGATAIASGRLAEVCALSGEASYPLYAIHYPLIWVTMRTLAAHLGERAALFSLIGVVPLLIVLSLAASRFYDRPMRAAIQTLVRPRSAVAVRA